MPQARDCQQFVVMVIVVVLLASSALASDRMTGESENVTFLSHWAEGPCEAVAADASWAWVGSGAVVQLFDVTTPTNPQRRRTYTVPSAVTCLEIWGDYLLVGTLDDALVVYDLSDPLDLVEVNSLGTGSVSAVMATSSYLYLACGADGLQVYEHFDDFDPEPALHARYDPAAIYCFDVELAGSYLLLASGSAGVTVLSLSAPGGPAVSSVAVPYAGGIDLRGDTAWVAASVNGVYALDISNPGTPSIISSYDTNGNGRQVLAASNYIAVGDGWTGVQLLDGSDPDHISALGHYDTAGFASAMAAVGGLLYVADSHRGAAILDVGNPANPTLSATTGSYDATYGLAADGAGHLYVANARAGLLSMDISNPAAPTLLDQVIPSVATFDKVTLAGSLAYVASGWPGLSIVDVGNPAALSLRSTVSLPNGLDVAVNGSKAYVAAGIDGVYEVDVTNPDNPVAGPRYDTVGSAFGVAMIGNLVAVADDVGGLIVLDFSGGAPTPTAQLAIPGYVVDIHVDGRYLYLANATRGLNIVDYGSNPANPSVVATLAVADGATSVTVHHGVAYLGCGADGVYLVDVRNPDSPAIAGYYNTGGVAQDVAFVQPNIFVADDISGFWGLSYDRFTAVELLDFRAVRHGLRARISWQLVAPDASSDLQLWRDNGRGGRDAVGAVMAADRYQYTVDDPAAPRQATRYWLQETEADGDILWHGPAELEAGGAFAGLQPRAYPNPFNPSTTITFILPQAGHVRVAIYDVQGRRVRTLLDNVVAAGEHQLPWHGRDDRGADAAAGTYILRVESAGHLASQKLSLVR